MEGPELQEATRSDSGAGKSSATASRVGAALSGCLFDDGDEIAFAVYAGIGQGLGGSSACLRAPGSLRRANSFDLCCG